jgi:Tol biopolymer transport system component
LILLGGVGSLHAKEKEKKKLPLEPSSKIEFTTDEGTWISLDVMPDGQSIVFELLGDLYRLPISGGKAERITEGMAFDSQPRVSPDGEWIAFISDRDGNDNLWISKIDGTGPRKLSSEKRNEILSPRWTPDSQYVIVSKREGRDVKLHMYHVMGGSGTAIGAGESAKRPSSGLGPPGGSSGGTRLGATMSPDGRFLYFAEGASGRGIYSTMSRRWQIARMDMRSGDVDVLTRAEGNGIRPVVSPDGKLLAYGTRHETQTGLRVRDLETGADRWLIYPVQYDEQEESRATRDLLPSYAFTPDGREIVITAGGKIHRINVQSGESTLVPFTADVELDVGPDLTFPYRVDQGPVRARLVQSPVFSPDGARLAFSVLTKIYVMDIERSPARDEPRRLTRGDAWEFQPAWSPDGEWIAYVTWSMEGGHIWKARADGKGKPRRLTTYPAFYTDIAFSPGGERIVGLRGNEYTRHQTHGEFGSLRIPLDLIWIPAEGGDPRLVVPARGLGAPHFAADPDRIYVYSRQGLISLRYDGTDRLTHLKVTGPKGPQAQEPPAAETVIMRPDTRWALAKVNNQLWVVAVPPPAGSAPAVSVRNPAVPAKRITDIGADYFGWAENGAAIMWGIGSTVYRRPFASIDFTPKPGGDDDAKKKDEAKSKDEPAEPLDLDEAVESIEIVMEFPRAKPEGTIALRGATVITMADGSDSQVIENADIVVTDNRVSAVGPRGSVSIPSKAREFDLSGKFIVPGFIDTHAHWDVRIHDVLEPQSWSLISNLAYGVTAGLDVQTSTKDYFAYQDLVETGQSIGQRAFMVGPGIFSSNDFQSYEAVLSYLRRYKQHYRTPNIKSYLVGNRKQRQWVVKAAKELQLMPTTEGGGDMKLDASHAIDGMHGNEHSMPTIPLYKDVVELYARTRTAYTPTLIVAYGDLQATDYFFSRTEVHDDPKLNRFHPHNRLDEVTQRRSNWARDSEYVFDELAAQAAKIQRAGGLVGVGGHGEVQGLAYHWEMWAMASGGMTPREVLQAATIDGARIIGVERDLGSIEEGKLADLVVLDADPLEDIHNTNTVAYVLKNGDLYEGDTLNQIWPVERELPPFWWWDADAAKR